MNNIFSKNSYYIFSLPVTATLKEVKKRSNYISAQLGIGNTEFEEDIVFLHAIRTEATLREAFQNLASPTKKITEVYFWYSDDNFKEIIEAIQSDNIDVLYTMLLEKSKIKGKWNTKRDLAILMTQLLFYKKSNKKYLKKSLEAWKEIIFEESSWKYFNLYYKNLDDLETSDSILDDFRKSVEKIISNIYSELSEKWDDPAYSQAHTESFGKINEYGKKNIFLPNLKLINQEIDKLTQIKWKDDLPSDKNILDVKKSIKSIQEAFNTLIEGGLYEEDNVIGLRDKASEALRSVAIIFTNKYSDFERSATILSYSEELSGTDSTKSKSKNDKKIVSNNRVAQKFNITALELINEGKYYESVKYIQDQIIIYSNDSETFKILNGLLPGVMGRYISETKSMGMEKIKNSDYVGAIRVFEDLRKYINENINIFDFNVTKVSDMADDIDERTKIINKSIFDSLIQERDDMVKEITDKLGENSSILVFICLLDCAYFVPISNYLKINAFKNKAISAMYTIGWWTLLINGIGLVFLIPAYIWQKMEIRYVKT